MEIVGAILTAIAGAGGGSALVAWRKSKPESEAMAVATLRSVLLELRTELEYKEREVSGLRKRLEIAELQLERLVEDPPGHLA